MLGYVVEKIACYYKKKKKKKTTKGLNYGCIIFSQLQRKK